MNRLSRFIATSFYTGYFPFAPGTVGSLVALVLFWFIPGLRDVPLLVLVVVGFFVGVWVAGNVEKMDGHDASIINVDEMVGMWLAVLFLPRELSGVWWVGAFLLFRLFDVFKPFPVGQSQRLPGGWGVMMDDVLAGLYTNLSIQLFYRVILGRFV